MIDWFVNTLRTYPEIAIFLSLGLGYYFGSFTYKGLGLGAVTATLIAAVGAPTTTAALGMITDRAKSQIPGLGYTVTYAVGNTLLTIWGMVLVLLLA